MPSSLGDGTSGLRAAGQKKALVSNLDSTSHGSQRQLFEDDLPDEPSEVDPEEDFDMGDGLSPVSAPVVNLGDGTTDGLAGLSAGGLSAAGLSDDAGRPKPLVHRAHGFLDRTRVFHQVHQ